MDGGRATAPAPEGDVYRSEVPTHGGYGMPRGPIAAIPDAAPTVAIGFCPMCGANARGTCSNRGAFDCPDCMFFWYDNRVGEQTRSIEDYFVRHDPETDSGPCQGEYRMALEVLSWFALLLLLVAIQRLGRSLIDDDNL